MTTAIAHRLLRCGPICSRSLDCCRRLSSSSDAESPPPNLDSGSKQTISSYVNELKSSLTKEPPPSQDRLSKPSLFSKSTASSASPPARSIPSLDELQRSLSEFRRRPPSASGQTVSLEELYKRNVIPDNNNAASNSNIVPPSFGSIKESLLRFRFNTSPGTAPGGGGSGTIDQMSIGLLKENLKLKPDQKNAGQKFPSIFGASDLEQPEEMRTALLGSYSYSELGNELQKLRPEKRNGNWFSLHELNERLAKLREISKQTKKHGLLGVGQIRETLQIMSRAESENKRKQTMLRLDQLGLLGGTPKYLLSPPKEQLVAKYFHPDNMSAAEKLKLELKKVRDEFKMSESDCGSARVQVAQLTTKIKYLGKVLAKKDKHSRKGLQEMVQRRKKLLKYMRRTDWDNYCLLLSKLGLRDNPDLVLKS